MISGGNGIVGFGRGGWPFPALAFALASLPLGALLPAPVSAQMFQDRPPPVPPAAVPDVQTPPAMNLAPPRVRDDPDASAAAEPADHRAAVDRNDPAGRAAGGARGSNQGVLSLTARYGKDLPVINGGLVWRVFADKPDDTGTFKLIREERGATPNIVLPPGNYVIHVALGLVSAVRAVSLKAETDRLPSCFRPADCASRAASARARFRRTRFRSRSTRAASSRWRRR